MENNKRNDGLDLLKFIAIIFVVALHIPLFNNDFISNHNSAGNIIQYILKMYCEGVPIFFFVNGYLLFKKEELDIKRHYKKLIKILCMLFIWGFILIFINILFDHTRIDRSVMIDLFLKTKGGSLYTGELWFLQVLFGIYVLYPLMWLSYKKQYEFFKLIFIVLFGFALVTNIVDVLCLIINNPIHINTLSNFNVFLERLLPFGQFYWFYMYFMLGGIVYKHKDKLKDNLKLIVVSNIGLLVILFGLSYISSIRNSVINESFITNSSLLQVSTILCLFVLTSYFNNTNLFARILCDIGKETFGIYITHQFFIRVSRLFIDQNLFIGRFITVITTLVFSYLFTKICKKTPLIKELFHL